MSLFPNLNTTTPKNKSLGIRKGSKKLTNTSMFSNNYDVNRFFSYDLSDLKLRANMGKNHYSN